MLIFNYCATTSLYVPSEEKEKNEEKETLVRKNYQLCTFIPISRVNLSIK